MNRPLPREWQGPFSWPEVIRAIPGELAPSSVPEESQQRRQPHRLIPPELLLDEQRLEVTRSVHRRFPLAG